MIAQPALRGGELACREAIGYLALRLPSKPKRVSQTNHPLQRTELEGGKTQRGKGGACRVGSRKSYEAAQNPSVDANDYDDLFQQQQAA